MLKSRRQCLGGLLGVLMFVLLSTQAKADTPTLSIRSYWVDSYHQLHIQVSWANFPCTEVYGSNITTDGWFGDHPESGGTSGWTEFVVANGKWSSGDEFGFVGYTNGVTEAQCTLYAP